jgi:two-component system alkaline phosphatase synthesis response regulator PhoP
MTDRKHQGKMILLVDDEPSVSKAIKMLLEYDGFKVQTVRSGEEALELYVKSPFDLVITDFSMIGMDGGELASRIKALNPAQPIIMATASIYKLDAAKNPRRIVDFIIDKPFSLKDLRDAITQVLPEK